MSAPNWTAERNPNFRNGTDAAWVLRYSPNPGGTKNPDGSTTIALSFPALQITDYVSDPEDTANELAAALNAHDELVAALTEAQEAIAYAMGGTSDPHQSELFGKTLGKIGAALTKVSA